jgi:diketogulonate reductase-like aldo/keto reductase
MPFYKMKRLERLLPNITRRLILRCHYQLGAIPIPKSSYPEGQLENISIFDFSLNATEMSAITEFIRPDGGMNDQDKTVYIEF